jgi:LacI family transcriptional regulator, galactose operon repressor
VFVDRPPAFIDADCVLSDNAGGAFAATEHLITGGHRRIAFLGDQTRIFTATERLRGYRDALAAHGLAFDEALVRMELHSSDVASAAADDLLALADPPTAIFSAQNLITIGTVQRLRALDLHRTIAQVGFDDLTLADMIEPGLTVVAQDAHELGRLTAELLFARLDGDGGPSRRVEVPTHLIERGSGELRP